MKETWQRKYKLQAELTESAVTRKELERQIEGLKVELHQSQWAEKFHAKEGYSYLQEVVSLKNTLANAHQRVRQLELENEELKNEIDSLWQESMGDDL